MACVVIWTPQRNVFAEIGELKTLMGELKTDVGELKKLILKLIDQRSN